MKTTILSTLLIALTLTGCQKQNTEEPKLNEAIKAQFEKSDDQLGKYLAKLDNPDIAQSEKIQIICNDFPAEYTNNYVPSLLKLQPKDYTEPGLLQDLKTTEDYYIKKLKISCS